MTKSRGINRRCHRYTAADVKLMRKRYPHERGADLAAALGVTLISVHAKAKSLGLKKSGKFFASAASGRTMPGNNRIGLSGRFKPGHVSHNFGRKGWSAPGTEATRFKKGNVPVNQKPVGSYRINAYGYLDRKVTDHADPPSGDWVGVHRLVWIKKHGPIPPGHVVAFRPGMRTNKLREITLKRIELIHRRELAHRNRMWTIYPRELAASIHMLGQLRRRIKEREEANG